MIVHGVAMPFRKHRQHPGQWPAIYGTLVRTKIGAVADVLLWPGVGFVHMYQLIKTTADDINSDCLEKLLICRGERVRARVLAHVLTGESVVSAPPPPPPGATLRAPYPHTLL